MQAAASFGRVHRGASLAAFRSHHLRHCSSERRARLAASTNARVEGKGRKRAGWEL